MVLVTAEVKVYEGQMEAFLEFLNSKDGLPATKLAKGCNYVKVYRDNNKNSVFLVEDWDSHEDYTNYITGKQKSGNVGKVTKEFGEFEFRFFTEQKEISFVNKNI